MIKIRKRLIIILCLLVTPAYAADPWLNLPDNPFITDGTYHRRDPSEIIYITDTYYMYYNRLDSTAADSFDTEFGNIACASSPSITGPWTEQSVVINNGDGVDEANPGSAGNACTGNAEWDCTGLVAPSATVDGTDIQLFYNGLLEFVTRTKSIGVATGSTADPCGTFTKSGSNPFFAPTGVPGDWDEDLAASQFILKMGDATWRMYYKGRDISEDKRHVGFATINDAGFPDGTWTRYAGNPVFGNSVNGSPAIEVDDMAVLPVNGIMYMMFQEPNLNTDASWYQSPNGIDTWTDASATFATILASSLVGTWAEDENLGYGSGSLHGKIMYMNSGGLVAPNKDSIGLFVIPYGILSQGVGGTFTLGGSGSFTQ